MQGEMLSDSGIALTSQVRLLSRFHLFCGRLDELLQCFVLDVGGTPLRDGELGQVATKFHLGRVCCPVLYRLSSSPPVLSLSNFPQNSFFGVLDL